MRVQDLMTTPALTCHVNDPLNVVAQQMWDHDCGAIAVVRDEGVLAGMITDRDICMAALTQSRSLHSILVNSAMAKHVYFVRTGQELAAAEALMIEHQIRRIPVVDADNRVLGMLALTDLAIEAGRPESRIPEGLSKVAHLLAAVSRRRGHALEVA